VGAELFDVGLGGGHGFFDGWFMGFLAIHPFFGEMSNPQ
jgi:hypothetical protein